MTNAATATTVPTPLDSDSEHTAWLVNVITNGRGSEVTTHAKCTTVQLGNHKNSWHLLCSANNQLCLKYMITLLLYLTAVERNLENAWYQCMPWIELVHNVDLVT